MVGRTAAQGRIPALKRTVFTSHGENARRVGRIRREPALSGAFRALTASTINWHLLRMVEITILAHHEAVLENAYMLGGEGEI